MNNDNSSPSNDDHSAPPTRSNANNPDPEESNNSTSTPSTADTAGSNNTTTDSNRSHRTELGIFERFMDNFLGINRFHARNQASGSSSSSNDNSNQDEPSLPTEPALTGTPQPEQETSAPASSEGNTSADNDNSRAIIITVNYVYSDEENPQNPNRSGSLIMSLPNNSSNRDPRVIQEFIQLATHMAYSSIINGLRKEKGITVGKFKSFPDVSPTELGESQTCSICFEAFDEVVKKEAGKSDLEERDHEVPVKKMRTDTQSIPTEYQSNARTGTEQTNTDTTSPTGSGDLEEQKLLSEFSGEFSHKPAKMPCGHIFGRDCLFHWLKEHTTCPLCRSSVAEPESSGRQNTNVTIINIPSNSTTGENNATPIPPSTRPENTRFHYFGLGGNGQRPLRRILRSGSGVSEGDRLSGTDGLDQNAFTHIYDYLRRYRMQRTPELFPTGVSSRRTPTGVESTESGSQSEILDFLNLRSLVDPDPEVELSEPATENNEPSNDNSNGGDNGTRNEDSTT